MQSSPDTKSNYPAVPCPLCDKIRPPQTLNKDGSVSYSCPPDHVNHATVHNWKILVDGTLVD